MKKIIQISSLITILIISGFLFTSVVSAQGSVLTDTKKNEYNDKLNTFSQGANYDQNTSLENTIATTLKIVLSTLGTIFIVMMFVAGNDWMQAAGNEEKVKKAKARIQSLIVGLVIILLAYALASGFSKLVAGALLK